MESAARGGAGSAGGGGSADGIVPWDGVSPAHDYREHAYQPQRVSRSSRWSDGPPGQGSTTREGNPSPAGLEPPFKRVRNNSQETVDHMDDAGAAAYRVDSGSGEAPPGLSYARSGSATAGDMLSGASQGYGGVGGQIYGTGYGSQQIPSYGGNYGSQQSAPMSFAPGSAKGATGALFYKTKLCTKFKSGSCTFNERCNFAHGVEELRKPPSGWEDMVATGGPAAGRPGGYSTGRGFDAQPRRTKLCRYFMEGNCPYGERCNFLHGNEEAQKTPGMEPPNAVAFRGGMRGHPVAKANYKSRLCAKWEKGEPCDFGDKCHFAHGPEELQRYTGVSTYLNGGTMPTDVQYPDVKSEMPASQIYTDPSMMNPPPLAAPYGAPADYGTAGGASHIAASNVDPYLSAGTAAKPYASSQDGTNGSSTNYNYWDVGAGAAQKQPSVSTQGYMQANQTVPWVADYSVDGVYYRSGNNTAVSQYPLQSSQQPQNVPFYTGGIVHDDQDPKQSVNTPYVQDDSQSQYQGAARNGDGYYHGAYPEANYPSQQADYSARYNMAEPWGGPM